MKTNIVIETNGKGLWSDEARKVHVISLSVPYTDADEETDEEPTFGELQAKFALKTWNNNKHGLVYTDPKWIKEFRNSLVEMGFSAAAAKDVSYSEQGMQGRNYVSMDVGKKFLKEWKEISK